MANVYIKTVNGGEDTSPDDNDAIELDDGSTSKWALLSSVKSYLKTYFDALYPTIAHTHIGGGAQGGTLALQPGQMRNGKIGVAVASNNMTLSLLTYAGTSPSASDPVEANIGGTIRTITSALSVTKNAGTNWCSSGSAITAAQEIDYFAYLGYNATDGVVIGFSRIAHARLYSDFSTTSTNEKYAGISTITNAAAGDNYINIGRFAATLSAAAGHNWSVPTFTNANLVNHPIFETREMVWVATTAAGTLSAQTGTPTTVTSSNKYQIVGIKVHYQTVITVTDKGTASNSIYIQAPFVSSLSATSVGYGYEGNVTGVAIGSSVGVVASTIAMRKADATTLWVNSYQPSVYAIGTL
jgi:hypothetical protein